MVKSVIEESGCLPDATRSIIGGTVKYLSNGRASQVSLPADTPSDACGTALRALLWATGGHDTELLVLPLAPPQLECSLESPTSHRVSASDEGPKQDARLLKHPFPQRRRAPSARPLVSLGQVSGTISEKGCVATARAAVSPGGSLVDALAGLEVVLGWQYQPATWKGEPVAQSFHFTLDLDNKKLWYESFSFPWGSKRPELVTWPWTE